MFKYNLATIVISAMPTMGPISILILILIVCAFEIIVVVLLVRRKETHRRVTSNTTEESLPFQYNATERTNMLNKELKPFGFAYYPKQDIFYSIMDGWQRDFGYCELYDEAAATLSMIIDCEPVRFDYEGKHWLIEFWKGQYGMTTGCEIGVYTTKGPSLDIPGVFNGTFYKSAKEEDFLQIGMSLRKNGSLILSRNENHWWLTGFKLGEFSHPSELVMDIEITLKDQEMCDIFIEELINIGYSYEDLEITNNTVRFTFDEPHSPQPSTRIPLTESLMQKNNQQNCEAYHFLTGGYKSTLDKLEVVQKESPKMYRYILNFGKSKQLFSGFETIKNFLDSKEETKD